MAVIDGVLPEKRQQRHIDKDQSRRAPLEGTREGIPIQDNFDVGLD